VYAIDNEGKNGTWINKNERFEREFGREKEKEKEKEKERGKK